MVAPVSDAAIAGALDKAPKLTKDKTLTDRPLSIMFIK
jgi:hypothetical protein